LTYGSKPDAEWRQFEQLVARIEADAAPLGWIVRSPDRVTCEITGRLREVDASIQPAASDKPFLVTIECRRRKKKEDVTWIEQLASKKAAIGADRTIAVSAVGFSSEAVTAARFYGIDLRLLSVLTAAEINALLKIDFVWFTHKRCSLTRVGIRIFRGPDWTLPDPDTVDFYLPLDTDSHLPIFRNVDTNTTWSLNDLWHQLQEATEVFSGLAKGEQPVVRTADFPYPGNVTVQTPEGPKALGDVLLSVALWLEVEQVDLEDAKKVEYGFANFAPLQRVEFSSGKPSSGDLRLSLQLQKSSTDPSKVQVSGPWPKKA